MNYVKEIQPDAFGVFAGDKTNLIEHFNALRNDQRPSFNIWALLLGVYWLAYKKLYKFTAIYIAVFAIGLTINLGLAFTLAFAMNIAIGFLGNKLFVEEASKHIHKISSIHTSEAARNNVLSKANKGSKLALIAVVCLMSGIMSFAKQTTLIDLTDISRNEQEKMQVTYKISMLNDYVLKTPKYEITVKKAERMAKAPYSDGYKAKDGHELIVVTWFVSHLVNIFGDESYKNVLLQDAEENIVQVHDQCLKGEQWTKNHAKETYELLKKPLNMMLLKYRHCFEVPKDGKEYFIRVSADRKVLLPL